MDYISRQVLLDSMNGNLHDLMDKYQLEDIGIYEEEGAGDLYFIGYTVRKNGKVFIMNMPYVKDETGKLALKEQEWTIQEENGESKGYKSLEEVFNKLDL